MAEEGCSDSTTDDILRQLKPINVIVPPNLLYNPADYRTGGSFSPASHVKSKAICVSYPT